MQPDKKAVSDVAPIVALEDDKEKKIKALKKKIKQVEEIIAKQAQGEQLNPDQLNKVASHAALVRELDALNK